MAARTLYLTGKDVVLRRLNAQIRGIEGRTRAGLLDAALFVKGESQKLTPVVSGNLRASAYVDSQETPSGPVAEVGYSAVYAAEVHENAEKEQRRRARRGTPAPPGRLRRSLVGQWKFLEQPLKANVVEILNRIARRARGYR